MQEVWLPVVGFEGLYEVSDRGRVKSLARTCLTSSGGTRRVPAKLLSFVPHGYGYWQVKLCKDGIPSTCLVHSLVAAAFLGPRPEGLHVCHGPGGKQDNRPCNLRYGTPMENCADRRRDGTHLQGAQNPSTKITEKQALYVLQELKDAPRGTGLRLARELGVTPQLISRIRTGKTWGWLAS